MSPTVASSSRSYPNVSSHAWSSSPFQHVSRWKGKGRADVGLEKRGPVSEGGGGNDGVVMPMTMIGGGIYDVAYVLEVTVGRETQRTFSLQVDTGSSDLWVAASGCSTSSCSRAGNLYNPSSSGASLTGVDFSIDYLLGHVDGPVYWDRVTIGGYSIENQALAAGTTVDNEPLSSNFNGILGLALPLNSVIAQNLPPVTTNDPDGAAWASNLFSITPVDNAPLLRYIGMTLERPGFNGRVPSIMSIGRHPSFITSSVQAVTPSTIGTPSSDSSGDGRNLVPDVEYDTLLAERTGTLFWKASVREVVVYGTNGERLDVDLGRGVMGGVFPSAVLDTGVPLILASSRIANAIYGAVGVTPAEDGSYYVPCSTPLNLTIKLDNRKPISIHPLDLTAEPPGDTQAKFCIGLIQSADSALGRPNSIGDMILGVPFLRNVYSVMAYQNVGADGNFERLPPFPSGDETTTVDEPTSSTATTNSTASSTSTTTSAAAATSTNISSVITPRLGLLGITDPTIALEEFRQVRVLRQPISTNTTNGSGGNPTAANSDDGGKNLSVGIIVLIALAGFVLVAFIVFGLRWWSIRRRYKKNELNGKTSNSPSEIFNGPSGGSGRSTPRALGFGYGGGASLSTEDTTATGRDKWLPLDTFGMGGGGYAIAAAVSKEQRQSRIAAERGSVVVNEDPRDDESKARLSNDNDETTKTLVNSKSTSTFRSESGNVGEQYIRHSRISWPPNKTEHLRQSSGSTVGSSGSKGSGAGKGTMGGGLDDRPRMDSLVLPLAGGSTATLHQSDNRHVPPGLRTGGMTSTATLLQNGSDDAGERLRRDSTFDEVPSQPHSLDEYAAYASPLSSRRRRSRSQPRKSQVDSVGMFSPLPSSTLGDFGDQQEGVGGSRSRKNKISVDGVEFVGSVGYHAHHRKGTLSGGKGWGEESGVIGQAL